jgi:NMD protein affecting ribosome stability and mRNA decay
MTDQLLPCKLCGSHSIESYVRVCLGSNDKAHLTDPETLMVACKDCGATAARAVWQRPSLPVNVEDERAQFEVYCFRYYTTLKQRGWSDPNEGSESTPESIFWRTPIGQYGIRQVEAAWNGWLWKARQS